jgi:hypothetical protein
MGTMEKPVESPLPVLHGERVRVRGGRESESYRSAHVRTLRSTIQVALGNISPVAAPHPDPLPIAEVQWGEGIAASPPGGSP